MIFALTLVHSVAKDFVPSVMGMAIVCGLVVDVINIRAMLGLAPLSWCSTNMFLTGLFVRSVTRPVWRSLEIPSAMSVENSVTHGVETCSYCEKSFCPECHGHGDYMTSCDSCEKRSCEKRSCYYPDDEESLDEESLDEGSKHSKCPKFLFHDAHGVLCDSCAKEEEVDVDVDGED